MQIKLIKLDSNINLWTQVREIKNLLGIARSDGLHEVPDVTSWLVKQIYHIPLQEDGYVLTLLTLFIMVVNILTVQKGFQNFQMFMFPLCSQVY
jgi:hypothetical protein